MEEQGMAQAAVMEVFAANDGWQWHGRQVIGRNLLIPKILLAMLII